jgi:hypothetical protein
MLPKCEIFVSHEGAVSADILMLSLESASVLDRNQVRAEQDRQFMEMLQEDEVQQAVVPAASAHPAEESGDRERIEKKFNELPVIGAGDPDSCRVRFQFQFLDNSHRINAFPRGAPASIPFLFARYYQFPREFALDAGYPMKKRSKDDVAIEEVCGGR